MSRRPPPCASVRSHLSLQHLKMSQQASASAANDIQERIAAARREAESLKEKIRAKKETSADTSCKAPDSS